MAQFFISNVVNELIDDAWTENRDMILPEIEPDDYRGLDHDDAYYDLYQYESDYHGSSDVDDMIARVEIAIEDAIADYRRIEYRRNFEDLGLERLFLDESELDYAQSLRDHDRNQYIERSVHDDTRISIWYTNGHFWFI